MALSENSGLPTALIGAGRIGGPVARECLNRDGENRVNLRLIVEPRGIIAAMESLRGAIGNVTKLENVEQFGQFTIRVNGDHKIEVVPEAVIPHDLYRDLGIHTVIESSGRRVQADQAMQHLVDGVAKKVIITANAKGDGAENIVVGINDHELSDELNVMGNASCTTKSSLAPIVALDETFGIEYLTLVTTHSHTQPHQGELVSRVDSGTRPRELTLADHINVQGTGALTGIPAVLPKMRGRILSAFAYRIPGVNGSFTTLDVTLKTGTTKEELIEVLGAFAQDHHKNLRVVSGVSNTDHLLGHRNDSVVIADHINGFGVRWTIPVFYNNEEGPARAAVDLVNLVQQQKDA